MFDVESFDYHLPIFWVRIAFLVAVTALAVRRNRNPWGWGIFGYLLPPIALLIIWLADDVDERIPTTATNVESNAYEASLAAGNEPNVAAQDARAARERYNALPERRK